MRARCKQHIILLKEEILEIFNYKVPVLLNNNLLFKMYGYLS